MSRKKTTKNPTPKKNTIGRDPIPWRHCLLALVCGLFLVVGFFGAARQHFSSIDLGIKNSKLRKQVEELEADQRRLLLTKEVVLSPGEIKKAAKKMGFTEMSASNIEVFRNNPETQQKTAENRTSETKRVNETAQTKTKMETTALKNDAKKENKPADSKDKKEKPKAQSAKK